MSRKNAMRIDAVCAVILTLTAVLSIGSVNATQEPIPEVTTEPTIEEVTEPETEPTQTEEPVTEATEPVTEETTATEPSLYDVPLSEDLQNHIIGLAERFGIEPEVIFAMIWKESNFNANSVGDGGDSIGLMQIQPKWHSGWMEQLNCPDLFDPYQNVTVGVHILADNLQRYGDLEMALVVYNTGSAGAKEHYFSQGIYSSPYSQAVLEKAEELRESK